MGGADFLRENPWGRGCQLIQSLVIRLRSIGLTVDLQVLYCC